MGSVFDTIGTIAPNTIIDLSITSSAGLSGDLTLYIDGVLDRTRNGANGFPVPVAGQTVQIGRRSNESSPIYGHITDFRIYDFALNDAEVSFLSGE